MHRTRRLEYYTRFWFYLKINISTVIWYSKRLTVVETYKFSSEFITLKTCTFRSSSKSSLLKLLCILTCFYEGTTILPLRINFFEIDFLFNPCSQFPFLTFCGQDNITRGNPQIPSALSAPYPNHPRYITRPPLPLIPLQGKRHSAPHSSVLPRTAGGTVLLRCSKSFLC